MQDHILAFLLEVPDRAARSRLLPDAFSPPATENSLDVDMDNSSDKETDNGPDMDSSFVLSDEAAQMMGLDMSDEGITSGHRNEVAESKGGEWIEAVKKEEDWQEGEAGGRDEETEEQLFTTPLQLLQVCFEVSAPLEML